MRYCKDCTFCHMEQTPTGPAGSSEDKYTCKHPSLVWVTESPVTGKRECYVSCLRARREGAVGGRTTCGPLALMWEGRYNPLD